MKVCKYTEEVAKDLKERLFAKNPPKPEPWLHLAIHVTSAEKTIWSKRGKMPVKLREYGIIWAVFVWDTRQVIAGGSNKVNGDVAKTIIKSFPSAKDNHMPLEGTFEVTVPINYMMHGKGTEAEEFEEGTEAEQNRPVTKADRNANWFKSYSARQLFREIRSRLSITPDSDFPTKTGFIDWISKNWGDMIDGL